MLISRVRLNARPRLHIISLPHTETTRQYDWCAFTSKTRKFSTMMHRIGYDVRVYAGEVNEAECTEHIPIVTRADQQQWFGRYDWKRDMFNEFDPALEWWQVMNARAATEIRKRAQPGDIIGLPVGSSQKPAADKLRDLGMYEVEIGIGYTAPVSPFRVFESYALRHFTTELPPADNVRPFDVVIPNFFEVEEFPEGRGDGDYYLFMGRVVERKGPQIAAEACRRIGAKLIVAGQGIVKTNPLTAQDGTLLAGNIEYVGVADRVRRAELMGGAKAVFVPTIYLEPFGGVAVEAMLCGTPVITSDWGAFTETVIDGVTGFRCHTPYEYAEAALRAGELDRTAIRNYAIERFSTETAAKHYDRYFQRIARDYPSYLEAKQSELEQGMRQEERRASVSPTPENFLALSLTYYRTARYTECIAAAEEALKLRPDYGEAFNNIAAAQHGLGEWDKAIEAAEAALAIAPSLELARNNLASSQREKEHQQNARGASTEGAPVAPPTRGARKPAL